MAYFNSALSKEDYFFAEKNVSAHWQGKTASLLGITGEVSKENFSALVNNTHPVTGKQLTVRNADNRRAGIEFCFNAPKSASIIYALTKDEAILEAHRRGVEAAMREIEADMQTQANQWGRKFYASTGNIIWAGFEHMTSRPVEAETNSGKAYVPDMHLHSHCYVPNVTWLEEKKRLQALEVGSIWTLSPYYEALYHSALAKELEDAGYNVERTPERWEIKGISRSVIEKFSTRTQEIEKVALEKGITDAKAKSELGARTRVKKNKSVAENSLYALWEARLSAKELKAVKEAKYGPKTDGPAISAKEAVEQSIQHWMERNSAAAEKRVLATAMALGYGRLTAEEIKTALQERSDIISAEKQGIRYITTREMLKAEEKMIAYAASTKNTLAPLNKNYQPQLDYLNDEQKQAIGKLLSSNDQISLLLGSAGVGKTSLLQSVKEGIEMAGKRLFSYAPSAQASRGVLREKGFENSDTIAALLQKEDMQKAAAGQVILIDEAGMVGVKDMQRIFEIADKHNARLILSGDPKQHSSVSAGDGLRILQEKSGLRPVTVDTIVRQRSNEPYRQAIEALAAGDTLKGYNRLDKMGAVLEIEDNDQRNRAVADAYIKALNEKKSALLVSPSHAEKDALTAVLRQKLKEAGKLETEERIFNTKRDLSFTQSQKQDAALYHEGMEVGFHQNVKGGFKAGQGYRVAEKTEDGKIWLQNQSTGERLTLPVEASERFQVYEPSHTPVAKGELIRITSNSKTQEGTRINNGQTYSVKGFTPEGHVRLSNGKTLDKDFKDFRHGYVETSYSSQGKDAHTVIVAQSAQSLAASSERQFYVSASRGTQEVFVYTDNKADLKKAIVRNTDRMSAQEVAEQSARQRMQGLRRNYYTQELNNDYGYGKTAERDIFKEERRLERE